MQKKFKPLGGIIDPNLSDKQVYIPDAIINTITKNLSSHLLLKNKAIVKNFLTIEIKQSQRKKRFDFKTKEWVSCEPKNRLSIKFNKKFTDKLLANKL